jgi:hypothetical protein
VFVSERGAPLTAPGFSRMVERRQIGWAGMRVCCGTPAAMSSRMTASIRGRSRRTWDTATSRIPRALDRFKGFWKD